MTAADLTKTLGGQWHGRYGMACCPAHDDRTPSLSISDAGGMVLVRCHAGCEQERVITVLQQLGLWPKKGDRPFLYPTRGSPIEPQTNQNGPERSKAALAIWRSSRPIQNTGAASYLASRDIHTLPVDALRFHPGLKHPSGAICPAMVALVTNGADARPVAIHRTYLARDGRGKAPVEPQKMMLGPCRGGAVRLAEPSEVLMVGEGLETCLACMQATGRPAWAALSTSGLRTLDLPKDVRSVIVLADGDEAGEVAARDCALRWKRQGRRVRIARPPWGMDFNDMLTNRVPHIGEGGR
jgi:putative DNA primase/helicase